LPRPQQLRQRARVETIGLRPRLADTGVTRRDDDHPRHVRLENPRDRPRIARHLQRNQITRVETLREQLKRIRSGRDPPGRAQPALRNDRHLTEIAMDIQRYRPHLSSLPSLITRENRWANDIDGSALAAQPGKSQGRPQKLPGSNSPIVQNGLPNLRSPRKPLVPVSRT
jgi:hypothetical protein